MNVGKSSSSPASQVHAPSGQPSTPDAMTIAAQEAEITNAKPDDLFSGSKEELKFKDDWFKKNVTQSAESKTLSTHEEGPKQLQTHKKEEDGAKPLHTHPAVTEPETHEEGPKQLQTHKDEEGGAKPLHTHPGSGPMELHTHKRGMPQPLHTHQTPGGAGKFKLKTGLFCGLARQAFFLLLTDALQNTKDSPILHSAVKKLALVALTSDRLGETSLGMVGSVAGGIAGVLAAPIGLCAQEDIDWVEAGGYTDEERMQIASAQMEMTAKNIDQIEAQFRQNSVNYVHAMSKIAEYTGGLIVAVDKPAGHAFKELENTLWLYDESLRRTNGNTPEERTKALEGKLLNELVSSEGNGSSGLFHALKRINYKEFFPTYKNNHPTRQENPIGERGQVLVSKAVTTDNPRPEELYRRELVAYLENRNVRSANGFEDYLKKEYGAQFEKDRAVIESVIQEAVAEQCFLDPYQPTYNSSMTAREILDAEFRASRLNMRQADQKSPSEVLKYLQVYQRMHEVSATRPGATEPRNINELAIYNYIKEKIETKQLDVPLMYNQNTTNIDRILSEELFEYRSKKPKDAAADYDTIPAFYDHLINHRNILNVKGVRKDDNVSKPITKAELVQFLNRLEKRGVMAKEFVPGSEPNWSNDLNGAWEDYLLAQNMNPYDLATQNAFRLEAVSKKVVEKDLDSFFTKINSAGKGK